MLDDDVFSEKSIEPISPISGKTLAISAVLIIAIGCGLLYLKRRRDRSRSSDSSDSFS